MQHFYVRHRILILGRGRRRFSRKIRRDINDACVIEIRNNDQYCLFYALELMRIHVSKAMNPKTFFDYKSNFQRQRSDVIQMMRKAKIPLHLPEYIIEEWGPVVQAYYDETYGPGERTFLIS